MTKKIEWVGSIGSSVGQTRSIYLLYVSIGRSKIINIYKLVVYRDNFSLVKHRGSCPAIFEVLYLMQTCLKCSLAQQTVHLF